MNTNLVLNKCITIKIGLSEIINKKLEISNICFIL